MTRRMWPDRVDILGIAIDGVTLAEAVRRVRSAWSGAAPRSGWHVITANPELVMHALRPDPPGPQVRAALERADMVVADGIGLVWASRVLGTPLPERVAGIELAEASVADGAPDGLRLYLLGGRPGVAAEAGRRLAARYPGLQVVGTGHGYFGPEETAQVVAAVHKAAPDLLLVGLGAPKQELWIARHRHELGARVLIGVGGALDVFAGRVRRAPVLFQRLGLEWAYRLAREPWRARRMSALPRFVARVLWEQWRKGGA